MLAKYLPSLFSWRVKFQPSTINYQRTTKLFESDHPDQEKYGGNQASFFFSIQFYYTSFRENRDVCLPNIFPRYFHDGSNFNHQLSIINEQRNCLSRITPTKVKKEAVMSPFSFMSFSLIHFSQIQALQFLKALYFASLFNQQPSTNNHQLIIQLASASRLGSGWSCVRVGSPRPRRIRRQSSLLFSFPAVD